MSIFNPDHERVYVSREIIPEESTIFENQYLTNLKAASGLRFVDQLHVSLLAKSEVCRIAEKYPKTHPSELIMNALADLELPAVQYAHIQPAEVFTGNNRFSKDPEKRKQYISAPLDAEGTRRVNRDAREILGYFDLRRTAKMDRDHRPHVSFMKLYDDISYAQYLTDNINQVLDQPQPIGMSHPIVEHRYYGEQKSKPRFLLFGALAISSKIG